jgi:Protein of unknown function (DUF2690)
MKGTYARCTEVGLTSGGMPPDDLAQHVATSDCQDSAITVASVPVKDQLGNAIGKVALRYSRPCDAVWARCVSDHGDPFVVIVRDNHGIEQFYKSDGGVGPVKGRTPMIRVSIGHAAQAEAKDLRARRAC